MIYQIPDKNFENFEKKIKRIVNKSNEIKYEYIREVYKKAIKKKYANEIIGYEEVTTTEEQEKCKKYKDCGGYYLLHEVSVEGIYKVGNYKVIGVLEHTKNGNLVTSLTDENIPKKYYNSKCFCDHCKTNRQRLKTVLVKDENTNEIKQVGKSCLKDYCGIDIANLAEWYSIVDLCDMSSSGYTLSYDDLAFIPTDGVLKVASEIVRLFGYDKKDKPKMYFMMQVALWEKDFLGMNIGKTEEDFLDVLRDTNFDIDTKDVEEKVKYVKEYIDNQTDDTDYWHNVKVLLGRECIHRKSILTVTSAVNIVLKQRDKEIARKESGIVNEYAGQLKEKISFNVKTVRELFTSEFYYGYNNCKIQRTYELTDGKHIFLWKTEKALDKEVIGKKITGTIKDLKEYKGMCQTILTRCKIA